MSGQMLNLCRIFRKAPLGALLKGFTCVALLVPLLTTTACNRIDRLEREVEELESRVGKLEADRQAGALEKTARREQLEWCVTFEADQAYWSHIKLNGKKVGKDKWEAPQYVWDQARTRKRDKIEECKLLYSE